MTQPNRYTRWLDRLADMESRASNGFLWLMIIVILGSGLIATSCWNVQFSMRLAAGLSAFVVALFPFENRFKEHPKFQAMGVVPHDAQGNETYGSYEYYDRKGEPIPDRVIQYRAYNRAKFIHFPLGLFVCMSTDWISILVL